MRMGKPTSNSPQPKQYSLKQTVNQSIDSVNDSSIADNALYNKLKREQQSRLSRQQLAAEKSRQLALSSIENRNSQDQKVNRSRQKIRGMNAYSNSNSSSKIPRTSSAEFLGHNRHPVKNYEQIVNGAIGGASQRLATTYGLIN